MTILKQGIEIKIRSYKNADADALMTQFEGWKLFDRGRVYFDWFTNFQSPQGIFLLAQLNDTVIGYYAAIASRLKIGNKIINAYYGPIFIHPNHRKKEYSFSTLSRLVKELVAEVTKRNGVFYGFPNPRLGTYSNHANHTELIKSIPRYVYVLRPVNLSKRILSFQNITAALWKKLLSGMRRNKDITVREIYSFDKRFDDLWERASKNHSIIAVRNAEYLNWRYTREPDRKYVIFAAERNNQFEGYIILKPVTSKNQTEGILIDLFDTKEREITKTLLLHAIEYLSVRGIAVIEFFVSDDYYEKIFSSVGFVKQDGRPGFVDHLVASCRTQSIDENYFYNPENWFINTADMLLS